VRPGRVPIPELFHSDDTDAPFESCLVCDCSLREEHTDYVIEKGYRSVDAFDVQETVFGYALCLDCHRTLNQSFSTVSRRRCETYLREHIDLSERVAPLIESENPDAVDPARWTRRCAVHGTARTDLNEYQIVAHCQGDELVLTHLPLLIGGRAVDELAQRLSNETLDELGGFRDEYFGLPPELKRDLYGSVLA